MAFFADALGHSALTGIAIGVIIGIGMPLWSMILFSLMLAGAILAVRKANTASTDTIIGVFSSTAVALGIVLLSQRGGFSKYSAYLIGDLLSIGTADLAMLAAALAVVVTLWFLVFNKLLLVSINSSLASSRGINVLLVEIIFTSAIAAVVTVSIQWVGLLIINSMLVLPASAARNISSNARQYHLYSVLIALFSGISGLILSYYMNTAAGATIVLISAVIFFATLGLKNLMRD
jgi:zinc transport system permease protein